MPRKQVNRATYTDDIIGEEVVPKNSRRLPPSVLAKIAEAERRAARLDRAAPIGYAPKGNETRPRKR